MGVHDYYVKNLLKYILGSNYRTERDYTYVKYAECSAQIDGVITFPEDEIAVEIESRTAKQVRGALLDLFFHRAKKKLLIIVPEHMHNPQALKKDAEYVLNTLRKIRPDVKFKVVILRGSGNNPKRDEDLRILIDAIAELHKNM